MKNVMQEKPIVRQEMALRLELQKKNILRSWAFQREVKLSEQNLLNRFILVRVMNKYLINKDPGLKF